ncbi:MAG: DUF5000 domain-containing lipoprotein [Candidatus Cryptobacteroides sp.]
MKHNITIISILAVALLSGCSEVDLLHPYGTDDGKAPAPVTEVTVTNKPGAAVIRYKLPSDMDLSYVKAEFIGTDGSKREARASSYVDSLLIEGFGDTRDYAVELRAYDKFENASSPVKVTVTPLTPPVQSVFESLEWAVDFGGFMVSFENATKANIGIYVTRRDTLSGEMEYYDVYYTEKSEGVYAVRGLPDDENDFGLYVQDHWGNKSEVLEFTTTPWREDLLNKKLFTPVNPGLVNGDLRSDQYDSQMSNVWDGVIGNWNYIHTRWPIEFPHRFTFDLGVEAKMSRLKTWQRPADDVRWQHGAWRIFKVYGCTELPAITANPLDGWKLIGTFTSVKPSGLPQGQVSDEDIQLLNEGEEFLFDRNAEPIRYIRFEILGVHSEMKLSCMSELTLWGQVESGPEE